MLVVEGKWVWDSWYCTDDAGLWHAFFLQADRSLVDPELRHWNVTHGHATSHNLVDWTYHGTVFRPSAGPAFDDLTVWTGSVVRDDNGHWTLFYTGTSRREDGKVQRIGRATSTDLVNWTRQGLAVERVGENAELYEDFVPSRWKDCSLRDPWVIRDPEGPGWLMYFTARSPLPDDTNASGAIGLAHSDDLKSWRLLPPAFVGGFGEIEVPQVFEREGRWYCTFCTTARYWSDAYKASYPGAPVSGIHYLVANGPRGPWLIAEGHFLDGNSHTVRYAPRVVTHEGKDYVLAFNEGPPGEFSGTICDPIRLERTRNGRLQISAPQ